MSDERSSWYGGCTASHILEAEERIVWKDDPGKYPYLREGVTLQLTRGGRIGMPGRKVVGYAVLRRKLPSEYGKRGWDRRVWYVNPNSDPYPAFGFTGWPIEAVWPDSVVAGRISCGPNDDDHRRAHHVDSLAITDATV